MAMNSMARMPYSPLVEIFIALASGVMAITPFARIPLAPRTARPSCGHDAYHALRSDTFGAEDGAAELRT
jgi:hypothetical protein